MLQTHSIIDVAILVILTCYKSQMEGTCSQSHLEILIAPYLIPGEGVQNLFPKGRSLEAADRLLNLTLYDSPEVQVEILVLT